MKEMKKNWPDIPIVVMTVTRLLRRSPMSPSWGHPVYSEAVRPDEFMKIMRRVIQKMPMKQIFPTEQAGMRT